MRAVSIEPGKAGTLSLENVEEPDPAQGPILVRSLALGVCGTDRELIVVGIVRHPDPVPCVNCALGEWDMCRNGAYTERGIKQLDGFGAERWRSEEDFLVKVN